MDETFWLTCHGAGRVKSRAAALRGIDADKLLKNLADSGITVLASGKGTIVEEALKCIKMSMTLLMLCITPAFPNAFAECALLAWLRVDQAQWRSHGVSSKRPKRDG